MDLLGAARLVADIGSGVIAGPRARMRLEGAVAVVTGAGAGIGLATARELHERGAIVWLIDADGASVEAARRAIGPDRAFAVEADVRDPSALERAVRRVEDQHGRLDIVVANAGVAPKPATVRHTDPADFAHVLDVNLQGVFNTLRPTVDALMRSRGHAVLVTSASVLTATPGGASYSASKAAVEALGRSLRMEVAPHDVTVGLAYFGIVDTGMTHDTLDADPIGAALGALLPPPLRRRITAQQAAHALVDGIERRAARTVAPAPWSLYVLLRGPIGIAADQIATHDPRLHRVIHAFEDRHSASGTDARAAAGRTAAA
jgi:NAD(P)-dependent dehydrogenase (short-subunit alcohol dehydrogenase family)